MNTSVFLASQTWLCATPHVKGREIFSGFCCFVSSAPPCDQAAEPTVQYLLFNSEESDDQGQLACKLFLVSHDQVKQCFSKPTATPVAAAGGEVQLSKSPSLSQKEASSQKEQEHFFLLATFEEQPYLLDHTQIVKIIKPAECQEEQEPAFISIQFQHLHIRLYRTVQEDYAADVHYLHNLISLMMNKLKPCPQISRIVQQEFVKAVKPRMDSKPLVNDILQQKYTQWVRFVNKLNQNIDICKYEGFSEQLSKELNGIATDYQNANVLHADVAALKLQLQDAHFKRKNECTKGATVHNTGKRRKQVEQVVDMSVEIEELEQQMCKEIEQNIETIFSFSQTQSMPEQSSLKELEYLLQQLKHVTTAGITISMLPQKPFFTQ